MLLKSQPNQLDYKMSKDKYNKTHTLFALKNWLWTAHTQKHRNSEYCIKEVYILDSTKIRGMV